MALAQTDLPELKRFTFFVSRRFEEGRERFRLHMGHFATLAEAEEWLSVVRDIYPGAWAGEAPGRKLRERATAAAAAQAQFAAGPQPPRNVPARVSAVVHTAPPAPANVPVVHAAPPLPQAAPPRLSAPAAPAPAPRPQAAQAAAAAAPTAARAQAPKPTPPKPVAQSTRSAPAAAAPAVPVSAKSVVPAARSAPAVTKSDAPPPAAKSAPPLARATPTAPKSTAPAKTVPAPKAAPGPAKGGAPAAKAAAPAARPAAAAMRRSAKPVKPVFEDSNVREVLQALADQHPGETREMQALPAPLAQAASDSSSLSDTQVLKMLETRRAETSQPLAVEPDGDNIPLLKPDDTGTRRALKEAVTTNAAVSFAVQLQWSVQPPDLENVPPLAIFSAYTLYTVEGSRDGRKWYGLRLGFFSDAISAKQVAHYVRSEFASVAVVPVSPGEKARASDQEIAATLAAPVPSRADPMDEFKLIEEPQAGVAAKAAPEARKVPIGRALREAGAARTEVGARERRGTQTLEETLEILGAGQLSIDNGNGTTLNDSGVRHLRVEVQKNSPFSKLLERLSERLKKA